MKRAIVIILVILLVAGGGAGGLMMMGVIPNPFNPTPVGPAMSDAEKAAADLAARKFKPPTGALDLVKVDDMIVPVIMEGQVTRRIFIIARLQVNAPANVTAVEDKVRVYTDAALSDLIPFFQKYYVTNASVDAEVVKGRLIASAKKVYGDMVEDVLLINVFEQASPRAR